MQRYRFCIEPDQYRRLQFTAAALFAVALLVAGLVVALNTDGSDKTLATSARSTTSATTETSGTDPGVFVATPEPPTSTTSPAPTTTKKEKAKAKATTTTAKDDAPELHCVTTTPSDPTPEPEDWATYWQTKPDPFENKGLLLKICVDDLSPKVGQEVTLGVLVDDPDAKVGTGECDIYVTWDGNSGSLCRDTVAVPSEPKPTPKAEHGRVVMTYTHTYNESGDRTIDVSAWSGPDTPDRHPYSSYNSTELRITVHK